jgi:hypothetical protein
MNWRIVMKAWTLIVSAALPALLGMSPQERGAAAKPPRVLWIFFSHAEMDLRADLQVLGRLKHDGVGFAIRPCFLVDDFGALKTVKDLHVQNTNALRGLVGPGFGLPMLDEEGLSMARALAIERLPAFCLVDASTGRAHVVYGRGARLSELLTCE